MKQTIIILLVIIAASIITGSIIAYYKVKLERIEIHYKISIKANQLGGTNTDYQNAVYQICNEYEVTDQETIEEILKEFYL